MKPTSMDDRMHVMLGDEASAQAEKEQRLAAAANGTAANHDADAPKKTECNGGTQPAGPGPDVNGDHADVAIDKKQTSFEIDTSNEDLARTTSLAWEALKSSNTPPTIFRCAGLPSRVESDDDGAPLLRNLTMDRMRYRLARVAKWFKINDKGVLRWVAPPVAVVRDLLATPNPELPILTRIVEAPIFAPDGTLCKIAGYSPNSKSFFAPAAGLSVPEIPETPTAEDINEAVELLSVELLGDFPFTGDAEKAHAIAALLCPFVRDLIDGPTPAHTIEAPGPGTGKTLLVFLIAYPFLGRVLSAMTEARDEDEWRKRVFAKLRSAPSVLLIDNVKRRLESGALASAITSYPLWEDRILGVSEIARVPVRCTWIITGNNPAFSSEMARRTVRIRLDAKIDRPWLRDGFRHPKILEWAGENRGKLIAAVLTIVQAWLVAGRPNGPTPTLGMFESWSRVMGGIFYAAGIPGFLGNLDDFYDKADAEGAVWRAFLASWWCAHNTSAVVVGKIISLAEDAGLDLGDKGEASRKIRLGKLLRDMRDRVFHLSDAADSRKLRVVDGGTQHGLKLWRLDAV